VERTQENDQTITYQMTAESLTDPPEPAQHHPLTIEKHTLATGSDGLAVERGDVPRGVDEPSEPGSVAGSGHEPGVDRNDTNRSRRRQWGPAPDPRHRR